MSNDPEIKYDGVLYYLPLYEDELVKNIVTADKHVEKRKDINGYIILTNYRFIFMERKKELDYHLSIFFYYKDIVSIRIGGVVNKFIQINGVLFHPKDVSVEYLRSSIKKFTLDAEGQIFSFEPTPEEEIPPEVKIIDENLFNKVTNLIISMFSTIIGLFMVLNSALWFYCGPHAYFPFVSSLLGVVFSSIAMGLIKYESNEKYFSEEYFNSFKITLYFSILSLSYTSVGIGLDGRYGLAFNLFSARNNVTLLVFIVYLAIGVLLMFKNGTDFSILFDEPENPFGEFNNRVIEEFESEKYHKLSKIRLIAFIILVATQMLIVILYNLFPGDGVYMVFSWTFSQSPAPIDLKFIIPGSNYNLFSSAFLGVTIAVGITGLILSAFVMVRNIGYLRYYSLDIYNTIKKLTKKQINRAKLIKEKIFNKTQKIIDQMHAVVTRVTEKAIPISSKETQVPIQENSIGKIEKINIPANSINSNSLKNEVTVLETPADIPITTSKEEETPTSEIKKEEFIDKIIGKIEAKRGGVIKGSEYIYKIKVENLSNSVITDLRIIITSYPDDSLKIAGSELQKRAKLAPGEMVSPSFSFRPTEDCIVGKINAIVTYLDARGESKQISVEPLMIRFICGLLTPLPIKAEEFDQIVKKLLNYSNAGEEIELPHSAKSIYEKAKLLLPQNNFYVISAEDHEVASNFIGILKGFAAGQYSHKKVGTQITITGRNDENFCAARIDGYTEDSSMLTPLIYELKNEISSWNCEQCGAQLSDDQIKKVLDGKLVRCKYCNEVLNR
ncbi:MAG: hypothetical protein ACFFCM_11925 [Promethearchaeota archaeon]